MLVYGDRPRRRSPRAMLAELDAGLAALPAAGIARHGALAEAFILAAELAQGLADAEFEARGGDARSAVQDAAMAVVMALARAVWGSWRSGFAPAPVALTAGLAGLELPDEIETREGEGYAFYALYPEAYGEAAVISAHPRGETVRVIGIRSIGTGLAAMVAAALDAAPPVTVRPVGHPFRRELRLCATLKAELAAHEGTFAVVDEGPGLSGSSFAAVARALEALGVAEDRIVYFPGHPGEPGGEAEPAWRERWRRCDRAVAAFDALVPARLAAWVADLTGPATAPLQDLSGGAWRSGDPRPPSNTHQERRKFLMGSASGPWLLKFAGLGAPAQAKLARAEALAGAGFTPEVTGLRHGFLVERWIEGAAPLNGVAYGRERFLARLGDYLAFRQTLPGEAGAGLGVLLEMARANTAEALGEEAAARLDGWVRRLEALEARVVRVETDNRLHAWEWLVAPDGRLLKTDALDHAHAHDLIGAQDIAWDVAGAVAEFDLDGAEEDRLARRVGADPELLAFLRPCYLAFQLGAFSMAAQAHAHWPDERARLAGARDRYARALSRLLSTPGAALA